MEKAFIILTNVLIGSLLLSALLHLVLLISDSEEYRNWAMIQIGLQFAGAWVLWHVRQYRSVALLAFAALSTYINAVYTNYGHVMAHLVLVPLFWIIYGTLIIGVRRRFAGSGTRQDERTA